MAANARIVHSDATHETTTQKYPLTAVGVTDQNRKFHLTGLSVASHETTLDYALTFNAMKKGVRIVTGIEMQPEVLMCDATLNHQFAMDLLWHLVMVLVSVTVLTMVVVVVTSNVKNHGIK